MQSFSVTRVFDVYMFRVVAKFMTKFRVERIIVIYSIHIRIDCLLVYADFISSVADLQLYSIIANCTIN